MKTQRTQSDHATPQQLADDLAGAFSRFLVGCLVPQTPGGQSTALVDVLRQLATTQAAILEALGKPPATDVNQPMESGATLLTKAEAARLCGLGRSTFDAYRAAGWVPAPVKVGNVLRWNRSDLLVWIEQGCPRASPQ
jgi:predicted DNA-binding transcriptional regulator AlpA